VVFFAFNREFASTLPVFIFGGAAQQHVVYRDSALTNKRDNFNIVSLIFNYKIIFVDFIIIL